MQYIDEKDNAFLVRRRAALSARSRNVNCDASHRMSTPRLSQSKQVQFDSFGGRGACCTERPSGIPPHSSQPSRRSPSPEGMDWSVFGSNSSDVTKSVTSTRQRDIYASWGLTIPPPRDDT